MVIKIVNLYQRNKVKERSQIKMRLWRKFKVKLALGTVHRYMSILGLYSIQRKERYKNAPLEKSDNIFKNVLNRDFKAYHISNKNDLDLVIQTLNKAFSANNPEEVSGLIIHSDRGYQYTSRLYDETLRYYDIIPSFTRKGTPTDNAPIESFYSTFTQECLKQIKKKYQNIVEKIVDFFLYEYNYERPQWNKKELTPIEYRYQFNS